MITFHCPKCDKRYRAKELRSGIIKECDKCHLRMRVVVGKAPATAIALKPLRMKNYGPLLLGASALAGILLGSGIFFGSSFFAGKPTPFVEQAERTKTAPKRVATRPFRLAFYFYCVPQVR